MKGQFKPKNPQKYKGNPTNIIYRSGWELKMMLYLDKHQSVLSWGSETIIVPYRSPIDNKIHRYYVDFIVTKQNDDGRIETVLVEVKPKKYTMPPKKPARQTQKYLIEVKNWAVNSAKWECAKSYCENRGWTFRIFTEHELGII